MKAIAIAMNEQSRDHLLDQLESLSARLELNSLLGNTEQVIDQILHGHSPLLIAELDRMTLAERDAMAAALQVRSSRRVLLISSDYSAEFLLWAMRSGVTEVVPAPAQAGELHDAVRRQLSRDEANPDRGQTRKLADVIAFLPAKGGSGATFLASNTAAALGSRGKRVALIDLNLNLGDAALYLSDESPARSIADLCQDIERLDGELLEASMIQPRDNVWVLPAPESPEAGIEITPEAVSQILELARERFDHVIVDAGRVLDARILRGLDVADAIYMVMQLALPYVHDAKRLKAMFEGLGYASGKLRVVVNRYERGTDIGVRDVEEALQQKVALKVPNDFKTVTYAINHALPVFEHRKRGAITDAVFALADQIYHARKSESVLRKTFRLRTPLAMVPSRG